MTTPTPNDVAADTGQPILSRMRFENPHKFLEFYQKQLSRGIVGLRHPHPIAPGSAFTVIISPPGAPNQLQLSGVARRVSLRPDGAYRLRLSVTPTPVDEAWLEGYVAGQRAALTHGQQSDNDNSISGSVITDGTGSWSTPPAAAAPRRPALPTSVEIYDLARRLDRIDYYVLLGVPRDVEHADLQSRFHLLTRRFHPDLFHGREEGLGKAVGRVYRRMNEAYAVLRSSERRAQYDSGLAQPYEERQVRLSGDAQNAARRREETPGATTSVGEFYWDRARVMLKSSQGATGTTPKPVLEEAIRLLHTALIFEPRNSHFQTALTHLRGQVR